MKFETKYRIGVKDIGKNNKMTNYAYLSALEEIASYHSATVGYGVNDIDKNKKAWIIMDWKLKVLKRAIYEDEITVKTWARPINGKSFYTYRDFEVFNNGERIAIATSKWVMFDIEKNKIFKLTDDIIDLYHPDTDQVFEESELEKLKEKDEKEFALQYNVKRFDIDINKHVHNLNYLRIAYECLPEEVFNGNEKNNIRIMYKHQIVLGDEVNCYYTKKEGKNIITIKSKDDKILHSIIELYD